MNTPLKLSRRSFVLSAMCLAACKPGSAMIELSGNTMGTRFSVIGVDHDRSVDKAELQGKIDLALARVNTLMSNWDAGSEVSLFNRQTSTAPVSVSSELAAVVAASEAVHAQSDGYFDITLGPVIETWGFGAPASTSSTPTDDVLQHAMNGVGQGNLTISGNQLAKSNPDTQMYLSSIGKGFGVDYVADAVKSAGLTDFMVEIGGDLYVSGKNAEAMSWQIGIESPDLLSTQVFQIAKASNLGMATSGDYRNYFEENGTRFSHIIDPKTGRPVLHDTTSVTVLAENAMLADAWATALLAMGTQKGFELASDLGIAALFIDRAASANHMTFEDTATQAFIALQA